MTYGIDSLRCYASGAVKLSLHFSLSFPLSLTKNKTIGSHLKYREMVTNNSAIPDKASKQATTAYHHRNIFPTCNICTFFRLATSPR